MKKINDKKQIYEAPVVYEMSGAMATYLLAGSNSMPGLVEQQDNNEYKETKAQDYPTVGSGDVLAKPHSFFWEMSEDE